MLNPIYNLPKIDFVGGESREIYFRIYTRDGKEYNTTDCEIKFSIINYSNKNGDPEVVKDTIVSNSASGMPCIVKVELQPEDTVYLYGKYIYQLSIRDMVGEVEIPGQGVIMINRNIHQGFIV